jgi:hypothetical protein
MHLDILYIYHRSTSIIKIIHIEKSKQSIVIERVKSKRFQSPEQSALEKLLSFREKKPVHLTTIIITWECRPPSARYHLNPGPPVLSNSQSLAHTGNSPDNEGRTPPAAGSRSTRCCPVG